MATSSSSAQDALQDVIDREALGVGDRRYAVEAAEDALVRGLDSQALRVVAGFGPDTPTDDWNAWWSRVAVDLALSRGSHPDALLRAVRRLAASTLAGARTPISTARDVWDLSLATQLMPISVQPFIYAASEWDERPEDHALFDRMILEAARYLVGEDRDTSEPVIGESQTTAADGVTSRTDPGTKDDSVGK